MGVVKTSTTGKQKSCLMMVLLIVIGTMPLIYSIPSAEASVSGDVGITGSTPVENDWISIYDSIYFSVEVVNNFQQQSPARVVNWHVCEGVKVANQCIGSAVDDGLIAIPPLIPFTVQEFTSTNSFSPNGFNGNMTVVYQFDQMDQNPTDDVFVFVINSTNEYTDLKIDTDYDILSVLSNLPEDNGQLIINADTNYSLTIKGYSHLCPTCNISAAIGWQIRDATGKNKLSESYTNRTEFPRFSYYKPFDATLPNLSFADDGYFMLMYGYFTHSGDPNEDMIPTNNFHVRPILVDSTVDLEVSSLEPAHDPTSDTYFYGQDMVYSIIKNKGNKTINDAEIQLEAVNIIGEVVYESECYTGTIYPGGQVGCNFDLLTDGQDLTIRIVSPNQMNEGNDNITFNNVLEESTDIIIPALTSYVIFEEPKEWYTNNEFINISGFTNIYSPGPINYSWWYSGLINMGWSSDISINTSELGLGQHTIRFTTRDYFGNTENIYLLLNIYFEVYWENLPASEAIGVTLDESTITHSSMLPIAGETYGIGNGKNPLLLMSFDLIDPIESNSLLTGSNWIDVTLNISSILPSTIAFSTVEVRKLDSEQDLIWETFDETLVTYRDGSFIDVRIFEKTTILIIGVMEAPDVEAQSFAANLEQGGTFMLNWNSTGEIDNDYILGWNLYQKIVSINGGTVFPSSNQEYNEVVWLDLTNNTFRAFVPIETESWFDNIPLSNDFCASYAIVPVDRRGVPFYDRANVTVDENGDGAFICGDSDPPAISVSQFTHTWEFTNDSDCYKLENDWSMCYKVDLSWVWPEGSEDENATWSLYRLDRNPNGVDLTLANPILTDIISQSGEKFEFTQYGYEDDGIRPLRGYYYVLTPTDWVGNERTMVIYPSQNTERVYIEDDWWNYYQHLIPEPEPEPEPPLGNEWLGNFSDSLESEEFKIAGLVTLITLTISMIMIPLLIKKRKRLKRVVDARNRKKAAESMANEFDDFFN